MLLPTLKVGDVDRGVVLHSSMSGRRKEGMRGSIVVPLAEHPAEWVGVFVAWAV